MESLADTLLERVEILLQRNKEPIRSTTSTSVAIGELAARTEALEDALREIAREVQEQSARR